ncbi:MAG: hypothetical protein UCV58_04500 [Clostridium saudiense]|uniref:hypothetical protein n=1 Tax=uncultured Clostridium sp. TaxID=59620 RepID=UPI0008214C7F|nr:hypothetical protein [uncultured Clostridium sp.]MEE0725769.1 hypothetical protein [Clostridium saudiense]SCJ95721.1 Uncharacterised protein [uncultured Clostridium sp.]
MKRIYDAFDLLNASESMLNDIKLLYNECIYESELSFNLKLNIKYFLENIRSCLDYTTNYIFDTYCRENYESKDLKNVENRIYFPVLHDKKTFDKRIKNRFKGLSSEDSIVIIWERHQPYNGISWTDNLTKLTNKNKHIELIKNSRTESGTINYMIDNNGNTFTNCTFSNCGAAMIINGQPINSKNANSNPNIKFFNGDIKAEYYFSETKTAVLETLEEILIGAKTLIAELKKEL